MWLRILIIGLNRHTSSCWDPQRGTFERYWRDAFKNVGAILGVPASCANYPRVRVGCTKKIYENMGECFWCERTWLSGNYPDKKSVEMNWIKNELNFLAQHWCPCGKAFSNELKLALWQGLKIRKGHLVNVLRQMGECIQSSNCISEWIQSYQANN